MDERNQVSLGPALLIAGGLRGWEASTTEREVPELGFAVEPIWRILGETRRLGTVIRPFAEYSSGALK